MASSAETTRIVCFITLSVICFTNSILAEPIAPIPRRLPPAGLTLKPEVTANLKQQLDKVRQRFAKVQDHPQATDAEIFIQAVRLALRHGEFYQPADADRALELLRLANERIEALEKNQPQWTSARGNVVRGYRSSVDGSSQPYGLVIPEKLDLSQPVPLYVWLHGRGDKVTNLAFIHQRLSKPGQIAPADAIVVHPFGRQCIGWKSAGEIDVLEAVDHVASQYDIDHRRIVLMGFSMGGAGVWHIGAHYPDRWVAMSPGAGFAETSRYANVDPTTIPSYQRQLWGVYDVPNYVRNLFNLPVVAYSGENDKQIQAARVMEEAFAAEGQKLNHQIGPGMGHKYHPDTLAHILKVMKTARDRGLERSPDEVFLQTRTLRYHKVHWVDVQGLDRHWDDSRVNARRAAADKIEITTKNITALRLSPHKLPSRVEVIIDGQTVNASPTANRIGPSPALSLIKTNDRWQPGERDNAALAKRPGLQGPIDDAFMAPFLVVLPSGKCQHPAVQRWVDFESAHFLDRWQAAFRGEARVKRDQDVTAEDMANYNLILWGDPAANSIISQLGQKLPIRWTAERIKVNDQTEVPSSRHALIMIYPNPEAPNRYILFNSGPTFREAHDRTNSLQNPKLPDWAVVDLSQPPTAEAAGKVIAADFFDEHWQVASE